MVRDAKIVLDVNKTRQIAQEIVKVPQGLGLPPEMHGLSSDQQSGLKKKFKFDLKNTTLQVKKSFAQMSPLGLVS